MSSMTDLARAEGLLWSASRSGGRLRVVDFDGLYREHAPAITASLARWFGARRLDVIEAAVQEAFVSAIEGWGTHVPNRPGAWLQVAARRRVIDALRRATWIAPGDELDAPACAADPDEDLLKMMFADRAVDGVHVDSPFKESSHDARRSGQAPVSW
jgi:DNA-directed RNA polymerase specialized sigma24 family protein